MLHIGATSPRSRFASVLVAGAVVVCAVRADGAGVSLSIEPAFQQERVISGSPIGGGSFEVRVQRGTSGQARGVYEFALPVLPTGSTIQSAQLDYYVSGLQFGGYGPDVSFHGYSGNGVFSASDATVPFNQIGRTGNLTGGDTGARTTPLNASYVQGRYNAGASHLGVMAYAEATDRYLGINRGPGGAIPTLDLSVTVPNAGQLVTRPVFDVEASSNNGVNFVLTDGDFGINVQQIAFANVDRRGILEFDLRGIPQGAEITSASIEFEINTYTYDPPANGPEVRLYGYAGNGQVDVADATRTSIPIGTGPTVTDLGPTTITLNASVIENLLGGSGSGYLGLLALGSADFNQFGFDTLEWDTATAPHLTLNYALPALPGDFNDDSAVNAADIDLLTAAIRASSGNLSFDVNGDNAVTDDDFAFYIEEILDTRPGDANLDGVVDLDDLAALAANYGQSPRGWGQGNANTDLAVNLIDLTAMATYYEGGQSQALADWQLLASVPEPGMLGIAMCFAPAVMRRRR